MAYIKDFIYGLKLFSIYYYWLIVIFIFKTLKFISILLPLARKALICK